MRKQLRTAYMDVEESIDLNLPSSDTFICIMRINEDGKINYYLVHCPDWDADDSLLLIDEVTYLCLKHFAQLEGGLK